MPKNMEEIKTKEQQEIIDRIEFLHADIIITKAQLEAGQRIIGVIIPFQDHKTAPGTIGYKANVTYLKIDDLDKKVLTEHIEKSEKELRKLNAKRVVNLSFSNNEKNENEKDENN